MTRISHAGKTTRISCRVQPAVKEQAEAAARILGQSMTGFAETALADTAKGVLPWSAAEREDHNPLPEGVISENERIVLSERAFAEFLSILASEPEKPSDKLLSSVVSYKQHEPILSTRVAGSPQNTLNPNA